MSHMGHLLPILVLATFYLCCVAGEKPCSIPGGKIGRCVSIENCKTFFYTIMMGTSNRLEASRDYYCKFPPPVFKVCCPIPDACKTPDGALGTCVKLHSCPHLTEKLKTTPTLAAIKYTLNHRCSENNDRVCCTKKSFDSSSTNIDVDGKTCILRTLPPEYTSNCCGYHNSPQNKIIGGSMTNIDEYPWLALLEYQKDNTIYLECGGALISGNHVLTAAHCIDRRWPASGKPKKVRLGEFNKYTSGKDCVRTDGGGTECADDIQVVPIAKIIVHPEFNTLSELRTHDIALLKLQRTVEYTDFIRPICLPTYDFTVSQEKVDLCAAGWGLTESNSTSDVKMKVCLPYVPMKVCRKMAQNYKLLGDGQICAGGQYGKDSCQGDSGGPLMRKIDERHELVGIISIGPKPCGNFTIPSIYTKVFYYLSWIRHNVGELTFRGNTL